VKSRAQVARDVTAAKAKHPEQFCPRPGCLWRTGTGCLCPKHGGAPVVRTK